MKHSKETLDVVNAALALAARDVELGLVEVEDLQQIKRTRFAVAERKQAVALLKAEGKSSREIARELNIGKTTVNRDIAGPNGPPNGPNGPPKEKQGMGGIRPLNSDGHASDDRNDDSFEAEAKAEFLKENFLVLADKAASFAVYSGPVDEEVRRAITRAALAWSCLANEIGE
jgi:hypothetical protein